VDLIIVDVLVAVVALIILVPIALISNGWAILGSGEIALPLFPFVGWAYFALMESSSRQATIGKMLFGINVADVNGEPISFSKATGRYWLKFGLGFACFVCGVGVIGFGSALFTSRNQTLADVLTKTVVLQT
jgi:uncharacterized RDD family membrane protein YckC